MEDPIASRKFDYVSLIVKEFDGTSIGQGQACISYSSMIFLDVFENDILEIVGSKYRTAVKCMSPLSDYEEGRGIIRIDEIARNNAGVKIGDVVKVGKIKAIPAK